MKKILIAGVFLIAFSGNSQSKILPADVQIKTALMAAPEMLRGDATVLGYDQNGKLVTLRKGTNDLVCLADDPKSEGFSVACYSSKLEPYMARGRELILEGKTEMEKREIRGKEIDAKKLKMPDEPAAVYVLTASEEDLDPATGDLKKSHIRYVFYKPYMTAEETGLPTKPQGPGMPWLMDAGTHRSHIMITPPRE